jgi:type II secretory pathway predicted ATPase ExeA
VAQRGDQVLANQRWRHRIVVLVTEVIDTHLLQQAGISQAIPDEVETPMSRSQVVVQAGDRITDDLLLRR